jgi:hypothetical protein
MDVQQVFHILRETVYYRPSLLNKEEEEEMMQEQDRTDAALTYLSALIIA